MKKVFVLMFALLVIVALSACEMQDERQSSKPSASVNQQSAVPSASADLQSAVTSDVPNNSKNEATVSDNNSSVTISRDRAIELALQTAGVDKASAFDIEAELDRELGVMVWEVDFETREYEYSYDINANDGSVVKGERERND